MSTLHEVIAADIAAAEANLADMRGYGGDSAGGWIAIGIEAAEADLSDKRALLAALELDEALRPLLSRDVESLRSLWDQLGTHIFAKPLTFAERIGCAA